MATFKHISSKNADYGATEQYLTFEHDEFTMKPTLDESGRLMLREDYRIATLNCGGEDFAVACMRSNLRYGKNQKREDVKSHHYIISFDPRDAVDNGLTVDRAQALGEEFCRKQFPGHQAIVCTHPDGHNHSGNIHVHIVINSLRIAEVPFLPLDSILQQITDWLKEMLVSAIMGNLSGMFESVNNQVGEIATSVGMTPANFSPGVFAMVRNISESVIIPIAGLILTFIACYELIQMIIDHNNLANFETWIFFKWVFKTFVAVMLITNTFNITMAVFDVTQHVINASAGIISGNTAIDASALETMEETLMAMDLGPLLGLFLQSFIVQVTMSALAIIIFVIVYGRMIEIYLMVSLAPIPLSTFGNREQSNIGQNYLRSLFAIGFQGFLIMICVGIYAVLIQSIAFSDDIIGSIWGVMGYTVLLCFTLFKTGSLAKGVFSAH